MCSYGHSNVIMVTCEIFSSASKYQFHAMAASVGPWFDNVGPLGIDSIQMNCPKCHVRVQTLVESKIKISGWIWFWSCIITVGFLACCLPGFKLILVDISVLCKTKLIFQAVSSLLSKVPQDYRDSRTFVFFKSGKLK